MNQQEKIQTLKNALNIMAKDKQSQPDIAARLDFARKMALEQIPQATQIQVQNNSGSLALILGSFWGQSKYRFGFAFLGVAIIALFTISSYNNPMLSAENIESISNYSVLADSIELDIEMDRI